MTAPGDLAQRLRDALEGVTPGEWKCWNGFQVVSHPHIMAMQRIGPQDGGGVMCDKYGSGAGDVYASRADAEFVAHAPALMRAAASELDRLAAVEAAAREYVAAGRGCEDETTEAEEYARAETAWAALVAAVAKP